MKWFQVLCLLSAGAVFLKAVIGGRRFGRGAEVVSNLIRTSFVLLVAGIFADGLLCAAVVVTGFMIVLVLDSRRRIEMPNRFDLCERDYLSAQILGQIIREEGGLQELIIAMPSSLEADPLFQCPRTLLAEEERFLREYSTATAIHGATNAIAKCKGHLIDPSQVSLAVRQYLLQGLCRDLRLEEATVSSMEETIDTLGPHAAFQSGPFTSDWNLEWLCSKTYLIRVGARSVCELIFQSGGLERMVDQAMSKLRRKRG